MTINPETVQLTEEEKHQALQIALKQKKAKVREYQYRMKLAADPVTVEWSTDDYWKMFQNSMPEGFVIDKFNSRIIEALCMWCAQDAEFEKLKEGFSLRKGILLYGPFGCGKSTLMRIFQVNQNASYRCQSILNIDDEYEKNGTVGLEKYYGFSELGSPSYTLFRQLKGGWCFDDIAQEKESKHHYSNKANVVNEILTRRYYSDVSYRYTHGTTNADANELGERYPFLKSSGRLGEMFNWIKFSKEAPNYRKEKS